MNHGRNPARNLNSEGREVLKFGIIPAWGGSPTEGAGPDWEQSSRWRSGPVVADSRSSIRERSGRRDLIAGTIVIALCPRRALSSDWSDGGVQSPSRAASGPMGAFELQVLEELRAPGFGGKPNACSTKSDDKICRKIVWTAASADQKVVCMYCAVHTAKRASWNASSFTKKVARQTCATRPETMIRRGR